MEDLLRSPRYQALRCLLRERRKTAGLTQAQVAERLGRSQPFISEIERGVRYVDAIELTYLAQALDVGPGALLDEVVTQGDECAS